MYTVNYEVVDRSSLSDRPLLAEEGDIRGDVYITDKAIASCACRAVWLQAASGNLFDVLYLLTHLFDQHFQVDGGLSNAGRQ